MHVDHPGGAAPGATFRKKKGGAAPFLPLVDLGALRRLITQEAAAFAGQVAKADQEPRPRRA